MSTAETSGLDRFLSAEACRALLDRIVHLSRGGGETQIYVRSRWVGNVRWARNVIISAGETTDHQINITRQVRGVSASATTNRVDDAALQECLLRAERKVRYTSPNPYQQTPMRSAERYANPDLWSDATFDLDTAARAALQRTLVAPAMGARLLSAGYLEVSGVGNGVANTSGLFAYKPATRAEYSVTVRNAKGTGAGWAGQEHVDVRQIDVDQLSQVALEKCQRSSDPVAIEPGRYTVILEPQAVADLFLPLVRSLQRRPAEMGMGPWADRPEAAPAPDLLIGGADADNVDGTSVGNSKIGKLVLDERLMLRADPADPEMPFVPFASDGSPMRAVQWVNSGVLRALAYDRSYALRMLNASDPLNNSTAFRIGGGPTSLPNMIASTERGLLVTRFVNVRLIDGSSLLCSGTTSDGLWLIEHGKITGPVKNFRFRESPLFAFNNLEALGTPVRVLMDQPTLVPPAKVRDFSMTSLADAV